MCLKSCEEELAVCTTWLRSVARWGWVEGCVFLHGSSGGPGRDAGECLGAGHLQPGAGGSCDRPVCACWVGWQVSMPGTRGPGVCGHRSVGWEYGRQGFR